VLVKNKKFGVIKLVVIKMVKKEILGAVVLSVIEKISNTIRP